MINRWLLLAAMIVPACIQSYAQIKLPIARNLSNTYAKGTRTTDGKPGKHYWQNTADYNLNINFNPTSRLIKGVASIDYYNNSPDTLSSLHFKLYPNFYKAGSQRLEVVSKEDIDEGMVIDTLKFNNDRTLYYKVESTNMTGNVSPVMPGKSIHIDVAYHYTLNKGSHQRTGQVEDNAAFVAYFFPRIAVYDDIDGWNNYQYLGTQEFYNDFCNFKAAITVPKNFMVWATGDLLNCSDVYNATWCKRIKQAEASDTVIDIISRKDITDEVITADNPYNTWLFEAKNVTDFVFAVSDHYVWKSCSVVVDKKTGRRTRVDAVYNPSHADFNEVIDFNRKTVEAMSYTFPAWPFPYAHETVFDGADQMEYPMMVNDKHQRTRDDVITLTDHEVFHTMFPFYMGINETKYGWMDEGWATIGEWLISSIIDSTIKDEYGMKQYDDYAGIEIDAPVTTLTSQMINPTTLFLNSYPKPALGYLYIKDLLGDELFTKALHYYINQWHGKHPMPYDFFNCINTGAGKNLNWFWKRWFFDDGVPDLAIKSVSKKEKIYEIIIEAKGSKPVPIDLDIDYTDGTSRKEHRTVGVWAAGNTTVIVNVPAVTTIASVTLGSLYVPDINKADNVYTH